MRDGLRSDAGVTFDTRVTMDSDAYIVQLNVRVQGQKLSRGPDT